MEMPRPAERLFGLIGYPLSHSFSKRYFTNKFTTEGITDAAYELFPIPEIGQLPELLQAHPKLAGLNVTIPYKEAVMPYLSDIDAGAAEIGAVNTIRIGEEGQLTGYNTDLYGFENSLHAWLLNERKSTEGLSAYVLGTGGAAKAVAYALQRLGIPYACVSRKPEGAQIGYDALDVAHTPLIINTTPLGMAPKTKHCPAIDYEAVGNGHFLYDLVYNPEQTLFMRKGAEQGARVKNGMEMLIGQAEKAWQIWNTE